jgi:peptidoglycan hydrolase-like protein with peptidoglycan-binding domain
MHAPSRDRPAPSQPRPRGVVWLIAGAAAGVVTAGAVGLVLADRVVAGYEEGATAYSWREYPTALRELEPLARGGDWRAQALLAQMYRDGNGVAQDNIRAYYWFDRAAAGGDAESALARETLAARMTSAEIDEARRLGDPAPPIDTRADAISTEPPTPAVEPDPARADMAQPVQLAQGPDRLDPSSVRDLQWQLAVHGYDPGPADGAAGPSTRAAIRDYQADAGLPVDGRPTRALLDHLQYAVPPVVKGGHWGEPIPEGDAVAAIAPFDGDLGAQATEATMETPAGGAVTAAYTLAIQEELASRGYYGGSIDGVAGRRTRSAIRRYQSDEGLAVDGEVSLGLVNYLRIIAAN